MIQEFPRALRDGRDREHAIGERAWPGNSGSVTEEQAPDEFGVNAVVPAHRHQRVPDQALDLSAASDRWELPADGILACEPFKTGDLHRNLIVRAEIESFDASLTTVG